MQRPSAEGRKPAGHGQKGKGKTCLARPPVEQPNPVAEVADDSSSASSEDDSEMPLDVDPFEQSAILDGPNGTWTKGKCRLCLGSWLPSNRPYSNLSPRLYTLTCRFRHRPAFSFLSALLLWPTTAKTWHSHATWLSKGFGKKHGGQNFVGDSLSQPQVPELQLSFDDSGPAPSSWMTMVCKRKPVIDNFHKWLDHLHVSSGHSLSSPFPGTFKVSANDQLCGYQI